jgi:Flp pilus assembly protein TadG
MVKKRLNNKGEATIIWFFVSIIIFIGVQALIIDFGNIYQGQLKLKRTVDLASKAGALMIQSGENLAEGDFIINESNAEGKTKEYLIKNLKLDSSETMEEGKIAFNPTGASILKNPLIIEELEIINTSGEYTSTLLNQSYQINEPSTLLTISYSFDGILLKRKFTIGKLASSQLTSTYD